MARKKKEFHNHKYTNEERQKARQIHNYKTQQQAAFNRWQLLDIKIGVLKKQLNGKYEGN